MTTKEIEPESTDTPRFLDDDEQLELPIFVTNTSLKKLLDSNPADISEEIHVANL